MKVVILGAGNVATVLGSKIMESGHQIVQVINRSAVHGMALAESLNAVYSGNVLEINQQADLYLIALTDVTLSSAASLIPATNAIVVHTAGSVSMDVLKSVSPHYGIIYPLQSLNANLPTLPEVPVLIDGSTENTKKKLFEFCEKWSVKVAFANDEQRLTTHVAAVIVNNFTNHLMTLAEEFCINEGIDFDLLLPLIHQTVSQLGIVPAAKLQTGPAIRGDIGTIDKHFQVLNRYPPIKHLYLKITESIINHKNLQLLKN